MARFQRSRRGDAAIIECGNRQTSHHVREDGRRHGGAAGDGWVVEEKEYSRRRKEKRACQRRRKQRRGEKGGGRAVHGTASRQYVVLAKVLVVRTITNNKSFCDGRRGKAHEKGGLKQTMLKQP